MSSSLFIETVVAIFLQIGASTEAEMRWDVWVDLGHCIETSCDWEDETPQCLQRQVRGRPCDRNIEREMKHRRRVNTDYVGGRLMQRYDTLHERARDERPLNLLEPRWMPSDVPTDRRMNGWWVLMQL